MTAGYIKLHRSIFRNEFFRTGPMTEREAFMWMLCEASWKPRGRRIGQIFVELKRGQLAASLRFMADAFMWDVGAVRGYLGRLLKAGKISTATNTGLNVITICNYEEYQGDEVDDDTASDTRPAQHQHSANTAPAQRQHKREEINNLRTKELQEINSSAGALFPDAPVQAKPKRKARAPAVQEPWPEGFVLNEKLIAYAIEKKFSKSAITSMFEGFRDYHLTKAGLSADWSASWRTWVNKRVEWRERDNAPRAPDPVRSPLL